MALVPPIKPWIFGKENPNPSTLAIVPGSVDIAYITITAGKIQPYIASHKYQYIIYYKSITEYNITSLLAKSE
jgi:hypothetical protein